MFKLSMLTFQSNHRQANHWLKSWQNMVCSVVSKKVSKKVTKRVTQKAIAVIALMSLAGCISSYQPTIVQGNQMSNNALAQITLDMSKEEVQTILGNPLIKDPFTKDRWDYFYSTGKLSSEDITKRVITLQFADNRLLSISGDIDFDKVAAARETPEQEATGGTIITKPTQKKKGIFSR